MGGPSSVSCALENGDQQLQVFVCVHFNKLMRCGAYGVCEFRADALQNEAQWRVAAPQLQPACFESRLCCGTVRDNVSLSGSIAVPLLRRAY